MTDTAGTIQALRSVARDVSNTLDRQLRPLGVTVPQVEFLTALATNPGCSGADASRACHITPQTGTILLHNLTAQGLIEATRIPGTGRRHTIAVTDAGHEVLAKASAIIGAAEDALATRLGVITCRKLQGIHSTPTAAAKKRPATARHKKPAIGGHAAGTAGVHDRCRAWAADTSNPNFVPEHIAHAFGTPALVDQLVTAGTWKPDGNGYRIKD